MGVIEPPFHIAHPPVDVVERTVFESREVGLHERGGLSVSARQFFLPLQEPRDRLQPRVLFQQPVIGGRLIKEQRGGIDNVGRLDAGELVERGVEQLLLRQPAAVPKAEVVPLKRRRLLIGEPREFWQRAVGPGRLGELNEPRGPADRRLQSS